MLAVAIRPSLPMPPRIGEPVEQPPVVEPAVPVTTTPAPTAPAKPAPRKRGRPANPNKAPRGFRKHLMDEIEADMLARLDAEKAAREAAAAAPGYTPPTRWRMSERRPPVPSPNLTKDQKRRLRTEELRKEREDKARRGAGLLALAVELKAKREAQQKAAAERKAKGQKLTYEEWKRAEWGE